MDSAGYVALGRQSGLMREMQIVANNIANLSTTGFRREGMVFAEFIAPSERGPSLSMAHGTARLIDLSQAGLSATGAAFDLAIDGEGFFRIATPGGERLTRAGTFTPSAEGELVTREGYSLLDAAGVALQIPPGAAIAIGTDGTVSAGDAAIGQIGLWRPVDPLALRHQSGTTFDGGEVEPAPEGLIRQGFLEESNVNPVMEIARMIEVQRAYELGQKFLDAEDDRARKTIQTLGA
ncbi:flagellar hook-basal body complex protein [Pseudogemmobacter faecipullorum]|uniref:Flagellar hook-basal body complex protein n=1 Tax=Pseudogemmobacter faecipullorum TaxID=2755041 RepID=A0ABS8CJK1_9RHOB|nr:flagellar hook-basal body complex protein [Pseudogemmobacter faecipullorum]MCB5409572.1 flagellar hook-basal body complex protein [Pseudogemmobacter faecipullorum]